MSPSAATNQSSTSFRSEMKSKAVTTSDTKSDDAPQKFAYIEYGLHEFKKDEAENEDPDNEPAEYEDAIKACDFGKFHYMVLGVMIPSIFAQLFASGTLAYVIPSATCDLRLTDMDKGYINASVYAGTLTSGLFMGFVSDVFGRRRIILIGFLVDAILTMLASLSPNFWVLFLLKFFCGFIMTGPNAAVYAYIAETFGIAHRPRAIMFTGCFVGLGQILQPGLAYLVIPLEFRIQLIPGMLDFTSWRLFLFLCALPSLLSSLSFYLMPESPKFLMSAGRTDEALEAFKSIYTTNTGKHPDTFPIKKLLTPPTTELKAEDDTARPSRSFLTILRDGWVQVRPICKPPYLQTALLVFGIQICTMVCINSLRLWSPQLFASLEEAVKIAANNTGMPMPKTVCGLLSSVKGPTEQQLEKTGYVCDTIRGVVYLRSIAVGVISSFIFIASTSLIGFVGKRNMARLSFPIPAFLAFAMNWAPSSNIFMALVAVYNGLVENGVAAMSTITVELFPTAFRTTAIALQTFSGRIGSLSVNLIFPVLLNLNCSAVFFALGGLLLLISTLIWFLPNREEKF